MCTMSIFFVESYVSVNFEYSIITIVFFVDVFITLLIS